MKRRWFALAFGLLLAMGGMGVVEALLRGQEGGGGMVLNSDPPGLKYTSHTIKGNWSRGWEEGLPLPAEDGQKVVVCVGDSMTYGVGVSAEEAWPALLGDALNQRAKVYNFGVPGYDIEQVSSLVRTRLASYKPDLLIWGAYTNDATPTYVQYGIHTGLPVYVASEVPASAQILPDVLAAPLLHHSAFFRLFQASYYAHSPASTEGAEPEPGWYERHLDRIQVWATNQNVPLLVVQMAPHILADEQNCKKIEQNAGFCESSARMYDRIHRDLKERQIPTVDGLQALRMGPPTSFFREDKSSDQDHPNAEGHRRTAAAVIPAVDRILSGNQRR